MPKGGDAVDIGCGVGGALVALRERGFGVTGVEPDPVLAEVGRGRFSLDVVTGFLEAGTFPQDREYDLAYSCHVWEHLADPLATSRVAYSLLAPRRGHLVIVVPTFRRARTLAWAYFGSPHTYMFTHVSLTNLVNIAGFEYVAHRYVGAADTELWLVARALADDSVRQSPPIVEESVGSIQVELALVPVRAPLGTPGRVATHLRTLARDPADFLSRLRQWTRTRLRRFRGGLGG